MNNNKTYCHLCGAKELNHWCTNKSCWEYKKHETLKTYKIKLHYETEIEAIDEEEALEEFMINIESENQESFSTFIYNNSKAKEIRESDF